MAQKVYKVLFVHCEARTSLKKALEELRLIPPNADKEYFSVGPKREGKSATNEKSESDARSCLTDNAQEFVRDCPEIGWLLFDVIFLVRCQWTGNMTNDFMRNLPIRRGGSVVILPLSPSAPTGLVREGEPRSGLEVAEALERKCGLERVYFGTYSVSADARLTALVLKTSAT
jgi:hypothetical protein